MKYKLAERFFVFFFPVAHNDEEILIVNIFYSLSLAEAMSRDGA